MDDDPSPANLTPQTPQTPRLASNQEHGSWQPPESAYDFGDVDLLVRHELTNLKRLKRLSLNSSNAPLSDPDLPSSSEDQADKTSLSSPPSPSSLLARHASDGGIPFRESRDSSGPSNVNDAGLNDMDKSNSLPVNAAHRQRSMNSPHLNLAASASPDPLDSSQQLPQSSPRGNTYSSASAPQSPRMRPRRSNPQFEVENSDELWVPAGMHPELAPNEWRTFVEQKLAQIKNSQEAQQNQRAISRLSHVVADPDEYVDASDILDRRRRSDDSEKRRSILELSRDFVNNDDVLLNQTSFAKSPSFTTLDPDLGKAESGKGDRGQPDHIYAPSAEFGATGLRRSTHRLRRPARDRSMQRKDSGLSQVLFDKNTPQKADADSEARAHDLESPNVADTSSRRNSILSGESFTVKEGFGKSAAELDDADGLQFVPSAASNSNLVSSQISSQISSQAPSQVSSQVPHVSQPSRVALSEVAGPQSTPQSGLQSAPQETRGAQENGVTKDENEKKESTGSALTGPVIHKSNDVTKDTESLPAATSSQIPELSTGQSTDTAPPSEESGVAVVIETDEVAEFGESLDPAAEDTSPTAVSPDEGKSSFWSSSNAFFSSSLLNQDEKSKPHLLPPMESPKEPERPTRPDIADNGKDSVDHPAVKSKSDRRWRWFESSDDASKEKSDVKDGKESKESKDKDKIGTSTIARLFKKKERTKSKEKDKEKEKEREKEKGKEKEKEKEKDREVDDREMARGPDHTASDTINDVSELNSSFDSIDGPNNRVANTVLSAANGAAMYTAETSSDLTNNTAGSNADELSAPGQRPKHNRNMSRPSNLADKANRVNQDSTVQHDSSPSPPSPSSPRDRLQSSPPKQSSQLQQSSRPDTPSMRMPASSPQLTQQSQQWPKPMKGSQTPSSPMPASGSPRAYRNTRQVEQRPRLKSSKSRNNTKQTKPSGKSRRAGHKRETEKQSFGTDSSQSQLQQQQLQQQLSNRQTATTGGANTTQPEIKLPYDIPAHQASDKSLVMMYHRFPLHIERAIYRLSHMKLANPRRPLRQQVLLSNFMYSYLHLINYVYHEQQLAQMHEQQGVEGADETSHARINGAGSGHDQKMIGGHDYDENMYMKSDTADSASSSEEDVSEEAAMVR